MTHLSYLPYKEFSNHFTVHRKSNSGQSCTKRHMKDEFLDIKKRIGQRDGTISKESLGTIFAMWLMTSPTEPYQGMLKYRGDLLCLQSRKFWKHLEIYRLGSKSYLKKFEIAGIYGPHLDWDCSHIWSLLQPQLQA